MENKPEAKHFYEEIQKYKGNYEELLDKVAHSLELDARKVRVMLCLMADDHDAFMKVRQKIVPIFAQLALYLNAQRDEFGINWEDGSND